MSVNRDFQDLFSALNTEGAEFLVVGAYALAVHGAPRFTKDLDLWVNATPDNAQRVWAALQAFGAPLSAISPEDLAEPNIVLQLGVAPSRIDLLTSIDGVEFLAAWEHRITSRYGDQPVWILGRTELVQNKQATGRAQDALDAETLLRLNP